MKAQVQKEAKQCWSFRGGMTFKVWIIIKERIIIILRLPHNKAFHQLHINHMVIEEIKQLPHESVYWINLNADTANTIKNWPIYLDFKATQPKERTLSHNIPERSWESVRADIFSINNWHPIHIVDYYRKFPVIKQKYSFSADNLFYFQNMAFPEK